MKKFIKDKLKESLNEYSSTNEVFSLNDDKWDVLERDVNDALRPVIEKHKNNFGVDTYGVIDAIQEVFSQMFQKINR